MATERPARRGRSGAPATTAGGRPVRGSRTGRPIMALLDVLGRRWALRILWELRDGEVAFGALRAQADAMSPSVLAQRLGELRSAGIVERATRGRYRLTPEGRELLAVLRPVRQWAERWAGRTARPR